MARGATREAPKGCGRVSFDMYRGRCYAFAELMRKAAAEIKAGNGELKPARVIQRRANPKHVVIGQFAARLLRMRRRKS